MTVSKVRVQGAVADANARTLCNLVDLGWINRLTRTVARQHKIEPLPTPR